MFVPAPAPHHRLFRPVRLGVGLASLVAAFVVPAHEAGTSHVHEAPPPVVALPLEPSGKGPLTRVVSGAAGSARTGQGYWTFEAVTNGVLPLPPATLPHVRGAHGTLIVDAARDTVYWGLENVGWVAFSNRLTGAWVVPGDPMLARGNIHGADILPRRGKLPLVVMADNVEGEVYVSDTSFRDVSRLEWPAAGPYTNKSQFHPTDAAFAGGDRVYITDGYGAAWVMAADVGPFAYAGGFFGGKEVSQTPHGIAYDPRDRTLIVSARPEGQLKRWSIAKERWLDVQGLPPGSTVCDADLWGDYALAPCLDGPGNTPGPIYVIDLRRQRVRSVLQPKAELGFGDARHIHDAAWYVFKRGGQTEVYVVFTYWNPGGIGAMRLVRSGL